MKKLILSLTAILSFSLSVADIRLPVIFQHHMVLQRDKPLTLWGFADPGERVAVILKDETYQTTAAKDGKWKLQIPSQPAGGPYTITFRGKNTITLENILFGDVWLCGGQSNMQFTINQIGYREQDTARANNDRLRFFTAHIDMDFVPKDDLKGGTWQVASLQTMEHFSATAYFFGRYIQERTNVPIGLVSVNLGATSVECWMSNEALKPFPQFQSYYEQFLAPGKSFQQITEAFEKNKSSWQKKNKYLDDPGIREEWYKPSTDISSWETMEIPTWWEFSGLPDYDGSVWFRKEFDLPENFSGDVYHLSLCQIDDYDMVWVNGTKVGEGYGNINWRNYYIPANLLKREKNVLVVRVFDAGELGGIYTGNIWWNPAFLGKWYYKPGVKIDARKFSKPHVVNVSPFSSPAILFHGNIAPLVNLSLKGFIWYQGESNVSRAEEYRQLFPAMINDWRKHFKQGDLPFLFVQLANHLPEPSEPVESEWAELREAQAMALALPNTGMATAIDIGDAWDIHPRNKQDVGKRLALQALKIAYGKDITAQGPTFRNMEIKNGKAIISFDHATGLHSKDKYGFVRGFAIAGADRKFHWAKAWIENETVVVFSEQVPEPVAVRYAWADNPGPLDLYNHENLPAIPFRTDKWPMKTEGKKFN